MKKCIHVIFQKRFVKPLQNQRNRTLVTVETHFQAFLSIVDQIFLIYNWNTFELMTQVRVQLGHIVKQQHLVVISSD